jgi:uncharacterized alkaline shock family protein YloU
MSSASVERSNVPSPLQSDEGRTSVASVVVRKIAGRAAREVPGVHDLGTSGTRSLGSVRQRIPGSTGSSAGQGVAVEVGERQAAVDLDVVVEYGAAMVQVADEIRTNVIRSVERLTGLSVVEVNVAIDDIYVPQDDGPAPTGRVQ